MVVDFAKPDSIQCAFHPAEIGADYFPRFLSSKDARIALQDRNRRFENLHNKVEKYGYASVAASEMSRHRRKTVMHMMRNVHRYGAQKWLEMVKHAVRVRLKGNE
jgi:hypothetical protein